MKASAKLWVAFRMFRVVVFAIATIMSMALSVIYAVLVLREWKFYSDVQRAIVIIVLVIDGFSTILLYLMIIVRFRIWLDGARVSFLALFQGGATVTFAIFKSSLPCNNLGTVQTCETLSMVTIFGGWSLTGLLILYAFCLAIMSHIPRPPPPANPEESLGTDRKTRGLVSSASIISSTTSTAGLLNRGSEKRKDEKRHSHLSDSSSDYSQVSWIGSRATTPSQRSDSLASRNTTRMEWRRPNTPQPIRTPARNFTPSPVSPEITASTPSAGRYTPQPFDHHFSPITPHSPPKARPPYLPNPFMEPISRSGTPVSVASFRSDGFLFTAPHTHMKAVAGYPIPQSLVAGGRPLPSAYTNHSRGFLLESVPERYPSHSPSPRMALERLHNNSTPFNVRPGVATGDTRDSTKSPGAMTVLSQSASIHIPPNRRASLLSVPRSPSPHNIPPHMGLPATSRAYLPPAHLRLHPVNLRGPQRFHEVRRFGSSPDLGTGTPVPRSGSPIPLHDAPNQTSQNQFTRR